MTLQNQCLNKIAANVAQCDGSDFLTLLHAEKTAEKLSYSAFVENALAIGEAIKQQGVRVGGHVVIIVPHSLELYLTFAGCLLVGLRPSVFAHPSPKLSVSEYLSTLDNLLDAANPDLVVAYPQLIEELDERPDFVSVMDLRRLSLTGELTDQPNDAEAFFQFSSGTTGLKKCVPITFKALEWQVTRYAEAIALSTEDRIISWLPIYHDMGLIACFLMPLICGTPVVAMSPFDWVKNPVMFLRAFDDYQGTLAWVPNFCFNLLANNTRDTDLEGLRLDSVRGLINCSEPLIAESHQAFLNRFNTTELSSTVVAGSYAMAENTFAITSGGFGLPQSTRSFDKNELKLQRVKAVESGYSEAVCLVSSGVPLAGVDICIVDPASGEPLSDDQIGEISITSPSLVSGYTNNAVATERSFKNGWYFTGDQGFILDSELFVLGRLDDTLVIAGHNLFPQDVESCVNDLALTVPGRCVAFAVKDSERGTEQLVIVAEKDDSPVSDDETTNAIFSAVTANCDVSPSDIYLVKSGWLKKSTSGKLSRKANREKYLEERVSPAMGNEVAPDGLSQEGVLALITSFIRRSAHRGAWDVSLDDPILSSGWVDSLSFAELVLALEEAFDVSIPPSRVSDVESFDSPRQMFRAIAELEKGRVDHPPTEDRLRSWHQLVSGSIIKGDAPSRYQLVPHMRDADRLQKVNKQITDRSFQLSEPGFSSESLCIDDAGFRVCLSDDKPVSLERYMEYDGRRGAIIGNSTAFGIGSTNDNRVIHNCLNNSSHQNSALWYNFSARSATLNIQSDILRDFVPVDVDYVFWMDWLDPLRTAVGQFAATIGKNKLSSYDALSESFEQSWEALLDRISTKLDYATDNLSGETHVIVGLSPTPAWIVKDALEEERRLIDLFDHQANQVFTKSASEPIIAPLYPAYAAELKSIAQAKGFSFLDTNRALTGHDNEWFFVDRLHLTDSGQVVIADALQAILGR